MFIIITMMFTLSFNWNHLSIYLNMKLSFFIKCLKKLSLVVFLVQTTVTTLFFPTCNSLLVLSHNKQWIESVVYIANYRFHIWLKYISINIHFSHNISSNFHIINRNWNINCRRFNKYRLYIWLILSQIIRDSIRFN